MKVTTMFIVATMAVTTLATNSTIPDEASLHDACFAPDGPCTKLDQALSAGFGLLDNPHADDLHDDVSRRAEDFWTTALKAAAKRDVKAMSKRSPLPSPGRGYWCGWVGEGCQKVRRSAAAVQDILGDEQLKKRWASPRRGYWCGWVGQGCWKARRSIDSLLTASDEILRSLPVQGETPQ
jgi:hypothetical protein